MEDTTRDTPQAAQPSTPPAAGAQQARRAAPPPRKRKKSKRTRVLQRRLIVLAIALAIFLLIFSLGSLWGGSRGTRLTQENVTAQLTASLSALSATSYHYTDVERFEGMEDFYGWDASDYSSGFSLSYSGVVTAAVDPADVTVEISGKTVTVTLPEATVTANEITQTSLAVYNSNQGGFVPIEVTDFDGFTTNQQPVALANATAEGLLADTSEKAQNAVQTLLTAMAGSADKYDITVR